MRRASAPWSPPSRASPAAVARFEKSGWLGISAPGAGVVRQVSGAFAQTTAGTLSLRVAPGGVSDQLAVTGLARPAGTAQAMFQPGTYSRSTYALLAATDGVAGTFGTDGCPNNGTMQGPEVSHSSLVTAECE